MASRLDWLTELRRIIFEVTLDYYHRYAHVEENGLQRLREINFILLPESIRDGDDDEIAKTIFEGLKRLIIHFLRKHLKTSKKQRMHSLRRELNYALRLDST